MEKEQLNNLLGEMLKVRLLAPELKEMTYNDLIRRRDVYETTQNQDNERREELEAEGFTEKDAEMEKLLKHIEKLDDLQEELNIIENVVREMPLHELDRKIEVYKTRKNILIERKEELEAEGFTKGDRELDEVNNELFSVNELLDVSNKLKQILPDNMIIEMSTPASTPTTPVSTPTAPASTPTTPVSTPTTPVSTPTTPVSTPTTPVSTPTAPASTPTTPVSTPTTPVSTPTTPASTPTTPVSTPTMPMTIPEKKGFLQKFKDRKKDKIVIGRKAKIVYNGKKYKANRKRVKTALQMDEADIKDLFVKIGMDDAEEQRMIDKAMKDDILDPVVVNVVCSVKRLQPYQKRIILGEYIKDISNAQEGRNSNNQSNVIYDLKNLGKASIIPRIFGREVDEIEKEEMLEKAAIGTRYGIARQGGEEKFSNQKYAQKHGGYPTIQNVQKAIYRPNLRARLLAKITGNEIGTISDRVNEQEIPARVYDEVRSKSEYHEIDTSNRARFLRELKEKSKENGLDAYDKGQVQDLGKSDIKFYNPTPARPSTVPTTPISTTPASAPTTPTSAPTTPTSAPTTPMSAPTRPASAPTTHDGRER